MNYFTSTNLPRQALNTEIISSPQAFIANRLTSTEQRIFKELFSSCQNHSKNYISQPEIARRAGCSRKTVNETIGVFRRLGIVATIYRHLNTCEYSMNEYFFTPSVRKALSSLYKYFIPMALSLVIPMMAQDHEVTQLSLMLNEVIKTSTSSTLLVRESYKQARYAREANQNFESLESEAMNTSSKLIEIKQKFPTLPHGDIQLAVFPDEAIDFAMNQINVVYKASSPFGYFISLCKRYCAENGIAVNWKPYYAQKQALMLDNDAPSLDTSRLEEIKKELKDQKPETSSSSSRVVKGGKGSHQASIYPPGIHATSSPEYNRLKEKLEKDAIKRAEYFAREEAMEKQKKDSSIYQFCLECEQGIHRKIMANPDEFRSLGRLPNPPRWETLSKTEKIEILSKVHVACTCRDTEKRELGMIDPLPEKAVSSVKPISVYMDKIISRPLPQTSVLSENDRKAVAIDPTDFDSLDGSYFDLVEVEEVY